MIIYVKVFVQAQIFISLGKMPKSAINCWILGMFSIIKSSPSVFQVWLFHFTYLSVVHNWFTVSASLPAIGIITIFTLAILISMW